MAGIIWSLSWPLICYELSVELASLVFRNQEPLLCTMAGAAWVIPFFIGIYGREPGKRDQWREFGRKEAAGWGLLGIGGSLLVNTLIKISGIARIFPGFSQVSPQIYRLPFVLQFCAAGIGIPVAEELIFRGLMFGHVREEWPFARSAVITSLLFGIYHGNVLQAAYGFVMGMLFALGMEKKGTILVPITMHIWANVASLAITWFQGTG